MPLYKRGAVYWFDFTVNGERYRGSTQLRSKTAAKIVEDQERERAKLGASGRKDWTLEEAADRWFASRIAGKRSEKTTAQRLEILLRHIPPGTFIREIDAPVIAEAIESRRLERIGHNWQVIRAPSNSTVNRDLIDTTLRPIMNHAKKVLRATVHDIPWSDLKLTEPKERDRPYTEAEITSWRDGLPEWHRPIHDFKRRYGSRLQETFFPPENYDPTTGRVILRIRKNGRPHTIKLLPDDAADMNARWARAKEAGLRTVWFRDDGGKLTPIHWRGFQSASRAALDRLEIADAKPAHDLRHQAGTILMRGSGNLAAVKRMLGHENIQSTMRYVHADDQDVFDALGHTYGTATQIPAKTPRKSKAGSGT